MSLVPAAPALARSSDSTTPDDQEVVQSKGTRRVPAASVNFRKELGLPFVSLKTLGTRIDAARRAHDPVSLANCASELSVAEQVSGKKADITAAQIMKESVELAKLRRQAKEMQALLRVSDQVTMEQNDLASMRDQLRLAQQQVQADVQAANVNQEPTWKARTVVVNNYTTQYLDVYVNGNYKTQVAPGMQQTFYIEHRWNPTVLTAYGDGDDLNFGPRYIWGRFAKYTWNIN
jgi:hypothetical protein